MSLIPRKSIDPFFLVQQWLLLSKVDNLLPLNASLPPAICSPTRLPLRITSLSFSFFYQLSPVRPAWRSPTAYFFYSHKACTVFLRFCFLANDCCSSFWLLVFPHDTCPLPTFSVTCSNIYFYHTLACFLCRFACFLAVLIRTILRIVPSSSICSSNRRPILWNCLPEGLAPCWPCWRTCCRRFHRHNQKDACLYGGQTRNRGVCYTH